LPSEKRTGRPWFGAVSMVRGERIQECGKKSGPRTRVEGQLEKPTERYVKRGSWCEISSGTSRKGKTEKKRKRNKPPGDKKSTKVDPIITGKDEHVFAAKKKRRRQGKDPKKRGKGI